MSVTLNPALLPPGGVAPQSTPATSRPVPADAPAGPSFADVLQRATEPNGAQSLHFSKHALQRVQRRGIPLDSSTLRRLEDGVGRAAGKGSRDSVVLVDGTAFVVSVANRTVLTAVSPEHMREHVFTNIDSAVLA